MSDDEETLFESVQKMSVDDVARRLRQVADGLAAGSVRLGPHMVTPASPVTLEEEYSVETADGSTTFELELELKWQPSPAEGSAGPRASGPARREGRGKFQVYRDAGGRFRFRLLAGNGEIIASSQAYETKAAAQKGIRSVRTNATSARIDDQT